MTGLIERRKLRMIYGEIVLRKQKSFGFSSHPIDGKFSMFGFPGRRRLKFHVWFPESERWTTPTSLFRSSERANEFKQSMVKQFCFRLRASDQTLRGLYGGKLLFAAIRNRGTKGWKDISHLKATQFITKLNPINQIKDFLRLLIENN